MSVSQTSSVVCKEEERIGSKPAVLIFVVLKFCFTWKSPAGEKLHCWEESHGKTALTFEKQVPNHVSDKWGGNFSRMMNSHEGDNWFLFILIFVLAFFDADLMRTTNQKCALIKCVLFFFVKVQTAATIFANLYIGAKPTLCKRVRKVD